VGIETQSSGLCWLSYPGSFFHITTTAVIIAVTVTVIVKEQVV